MNIITSTKNQIVCTAKKLKQKKHRDLDDAFLVEGLRNVNDSIKYQEPLYLFCTQELSNKIATNSPIYIVSQNIINELCDTITPQGIVGVFKIPKFDEKNVGNRILILNSVADPGNVGTILRTACAMEYNTVIVDDKTADIFSPKVVRSAMSSIFPLNILRINNLNEIIKNYKKIGYTFYVSSLRDTSKNIKDVSFSPKNIIAVGNEANGISQEILNLADVTYIIPMSEKIESLNVAVATAISLYQANE